MKVFGLIISVVFIFYLSHFVIAPAAASYIVDNNPKFISEQKEIDSITGSDFSDNSRRGMAQFQLNSDKNSQLYTLRFVFGIMSMFVLTILFVLLIVKLPNRLKIKSRSDKISVTMQKTRSKLAAATSSAKYYNNLKQTERSLMHFEAAEAARRQFEFFNAEALRFSQMADEQMRVFNEQCRQEEMQRFTDESLKTVTPFEMGGYDMHSAVSQNDDFGSSSSGGVDNDFGNGGGFGGGGFNDF